MLMGKNDIEDSNKFIVFFILIKIKPRYEKRVYNSLLNMGELVEINPLFGDWDILIKCLMPSNNNSWMLQNDFIERHIKNIDGIVDISTFFSKILSESKQEIPK